MDLKGEKALFEIGQRRKVIRGEDLGVVCLPRRNEILHAREGHHAAAQGTARRYRDPAAELAARGGHLAIGSARVRVRIHAAPPRF
jgi:hypothetical protein